MLILTQLPKAMHCLRYLTIKLFNFSSVVFFPFGKLICAYNEISSYFTLTKTVT